MKRTTTMIMGLLCILLFISIFVAVHIINQDAEEKRHPISIQHNKINVQKLPPDMKNLQPGRPILKPEERERILKLPPRELVEVIRTGNGTSASLALNILKSSDAWKQNFDALLSIAKEKRGEMIAESLQWANSKYASNDEKRMKDEFLDFLEEQLNKDKPDVKLTQVVRSVEKCIGPTSKVKLRWREQAKALGNNIEEADIPYGNDKGLDILVRCLDSDRITVRRDVICAIGRVGANDPAQCERLIKRLEEQFAKEQEFVKDEQDLKWIMQDINTAIYRLKRASGELTPYEAYEELMKAQKEKEEEKKESVK